MYVIFCLFYFVQNKKEPENRGVLDAIDNGLVRNITISIPQRFPLWPPDGSFVVLFLATRWMCEKIEIYI